MKTTKFCKSSECHKKKLRNANNIRIVPNTNTDECICASLKKQIECILQTYMARFNVPGGIIGIKIRKNPTIIVTSGVGDIQKQNPINKKWLWPIRSITKTMTVYILFKLLYDICQLNNLVSNYLDYVKAPHDNVTLGQLTNMSSGIADYTSNPIFIEKLFSEPSRFWSLKELNLAGLELPQQFIPGTNFRYSNTNTNLIGDVTKIIAGKSFTSLFRKYITCGLNLNQTLYLIDYDDWPKPHATGYTYTNNRVEEAPHVSFSAFGPSGAAVSNIYDLLIWIKLWVTGHCLDASFSKIRFNMQQLSSGPEYDAYGYALGTISGWFGHTGEGIGFSSLTMYNCGLDISIVIFMNVSDTSRHVPSLVFRDIAALFDNF